MNPSVARPLDATLSVARAAQMLGVHANTVRAWSDQGRLRYYRINPRGDRRYRLGDLQRFLDAAETSPGVLEGDIASSGNQSAGQRSAEAAEPAGSPTASAATPTTRARQAR